MKKYSRIMLIGAWILWANASGACPNVASINERACPPFFSDDYATFCGDTNCRENHNQDSPNTAPSTPVNIISPDTISPEESQ